MTHKVHINKITALISRITVYCIIGSKILLLLCTNTLHIFCCIKDCFSLLLSPLHHGLQKCVTLVAHKTYKQYTEEGIV